MSYVILEVTAYELLKLRVRELAEEVKDLKQLMNPEPSD